MSCVGVESPRMAANGQNLGSARLISRKLFAMDDKPSSIYTLLNMVFGQLLDHDISHTPISVLATDISTLGKNELQGVKFLFFLFF